METNPSVRKIGHLTACIAGDTRYTDTLRVTYDASRKAVHVTVTETSAQGGRDGGGEATPLSLSFDEWSPADPTSKQVLELVKRAVHDSRFSFVRYGAPTRRFVWETLDGPESGLGLRLVTAALKCATLSPTSLHERLQ